MYRFRRQCAVVASLLCLAACKPKKAIDFEAAIDQKERVAFNIMVGEYGTENKKLHHLINNQFDSALAVLDQQETEFNTLIRDIEVLPVNGIREAAALKNAAKNYYSSLKELHLFDRLEITNRKLALQSKGAELDKVNNKSLELAKEKLDLYKKVYEKEAVLNEARQKFDKANGLK